MVKRVKKKREAFKPRTDQNLETIPEVEVETDGKIEKKEGEGDDFDKLAKEMEKQALKNKQIKTEEESKY